MRLLFDENLSPRLVELIVSEFPGSAHLDSLNMRGATDDAVWVYAQENDYIIVSKDNDFRQRSFLYGPPPKVISISVGNAGTDQIADLLRKERKQIQTFVDDPKQGLLLL